MGLITHGGLGNGLGASLQVRDEDNFAWANVVSMYELLPNIIGFWPMSNNTAAATKFVPLATPLTSTSWDGDAKTVADNGIIDLSAVFGVPAGAKAVAVRLSVSSDTAGRYMVLASSGVVSGSISVRTQVANIINDVAGIAMCDANGDVYATFAGDFTAVVLYITGYWIGL